MAWLQHLPAWLAVSLVSMMPVLELKASIPIGIAMGMEPAAAFIVAWLASAVPVPFILLFLRPVFRWMKNRKLFRKIADFFEKRAQKKAALIRRSQLVGLFILVAIPLPGTGVWTGALVAALMDMRIAHALPVIVAGNLTAGLIMTFITHTIALL